MDSDIVDSNLVEFARNYIPKKVVEDSSIDYDAPTSDNHIYCVDENLVDFARKYNSERFAK